MKKIPVLLEVPAWPFSCCGTLNDLSFAAEDLNV